MSIFKINFYREAFLNLMETFSIKTQCTNTDDMIEWYNNAKHGGSIIEKLDRVINHNPLRQRILESENYGFYNLPNVKANANTYYHIQILVTEKMSLVQKQLLDGCNVILTKKVENTSKM